MRAIFIYVLISYSISNSFAYCRNDIYDTLPGSSSGKDLPEVVIKKRRLPLYVHGDTISYDAAQYNDVNTSTLQDLLKKMPGFRVDENGQIFFNGKEISKILIDGDDLSGNRYTALSRNLRASLVNQLQVVQRFQENRLMKGHVASDAIALNIKIHDEYTGRPTGNVFASSNLGMFGALNADLLKLHPNNKQVLFLDKDNIGNEGLFDDQRFQPEKNFDPERNYSSWPFPALSLQQHSYLSNRYKKINNDHGVLSLTSNRIGRFIKLRTETNLAKQKLFQYSDTRQLLFLPNSDLIKTFSLLSSRNTSQIGNIRLVLERDNERKHISRYTIFMASALINGTLSENRNLIDHLLRHFQQRHRNHTFSIYQQETWDRGKKGLLLMENSFGFDNHHQQITLNDRGIVLSPYAAFETTYDQQFIRKGQLLNIHIGRIRKLSGDDIRYGIRGSFQKIYSGLGKSDQAYTQQKTYAYFSIVRKFIVKTSQVFQIAIGNEDIKGVFNRTNKQLIYRIEHYLTWQIKPLNKIRFGINIDRAATDLKLFHGGPLFLYNGIFMLSPMQTVNPVSAELHVDLTKIDLYKGLNAMLSIRAKKTNREQGVSSLITPYFSGAGYFIMSEQKNFTAISNIEQFIFPIKMKYAFHGSVLLMSIPQQLNDQLFQSVVSTISIDHKLISNWKRWFNIELNYKIDRSHFRSLSKITSSSRFHRYYYTAQAQFRLCKMLSGGLNYTLIQAGKENNFSMLDARIKMILSTRLTASFDFNNMLNSRYYREQSVGLYTKQAYSLQLNGRRSLFGLKYSF